MEHRLPIVFKSDRFGAVVTVVISTFTVWAGIAKITDDSYRLERRWGPFDLSSYTEGWLMVTLCLPLALYAAMAIVRGCPTLALDETGILLSRCFGGPVRIPWNRLAKVVIRTARVQRRLRTTVVDVVYLITKDGRDISVGPISGRARDIEATIRRVAAIMERPPGEMRPSQPSSASDSVRET